MARTTSCRSVLPICGASMDNIDWVFDPDGDDDEYCGVGFEDPTGWEFDEEDDDD